MSSARRIALSTLRSLRQFDYYGRRRRLFSSDSNAPSSTPLPTLREVPKTLTTSTGKFSWPDEYDWISKRRHAREFEAHVDAENRSTSSFFASGGLDSLAASLAAEARRLSPPSRSEAYEDSVPERIGDHLYFTRTGTADGSCSLLRKRSEGEEAAEVVVDVAGLASSQDAVSLGQLKLSPCARAVAATLDVGGGAESWRLVVVEAGGGRIVPIGSVEGVASFEWGSFISSSTREGRPPPLPPIFYTRGGAGDAAFLSASTLRVAPWDPSARKFRFDESSTPPLFVERDPSRVLALGKSKDGALLTLASASAAGSAAYAMRLPRREGLASEPFPSSTAPLSPSPLLSTTALTRVAPFEEGVEHYLEHCDAVPSGIVVMTTAAEEKGRERSGEFWLAAPLASRNTHLASRSFPPPSEWPSLLPTREDEVLTDVDVYRDSVLCYGRCASTGRPRLSLLRDLGRTSDGGESLSPTLRKVELPSAPASSPYCVVRPGANADPDAATARLEMSSPLSPPTAFDLDLSSGTWSSPKASSSPSPCLESVASELEVIVEETEGGRVPVTVVRPRRRTTEGEKGNSDSSPPPPRPVLLTLYGAYGTPLDPEFDPVRLALARNERRNGVGGWDLAFAHVRGGGELGRRWHSAGRGSRRRRVVEDAREVVEWLSRGGGGGSRRRRPVALCAESAGALVAGALLADGGTSRLLSAVSLRVPFLDVLSGMSADDGDDDGEDRERRRRQRSLLEHERGEFAPSSDADGDDAVASSLASVCPYNLLLQSEPLRPDGPPVLVTAAERDARAPAAGAVKWVSRLRRLRRGGGQGATSSSSVVLLEVLRGCGHAEGLRSCDDVEGNAREAAFLVGAVEREARENE